LKVNFSPILRGGWFLDELPEKQGISGNFLSDTPGLTVAKPFPVGYR
jgi:hypothetical protein